MRAHTHTNTHSQEEGMVYTVMVGVVLQVVVSVQCRTQSFIRLFLLVYSLLVQCRIQSFIRCFLRMFSMVDVLYG